VEIAEAWPLAARFTRFLTAIYSGRWISVIVLLATVSGSIAFAVPARSADLDIKITNENSNLRVRAKLGDSVAEFATKPGTLEKLISLYLSVECRNNPQCTRQFAPTLMTQQTHALELNTFENNLVALGVEILTPLREQIGKADRIRFVLDETLLRLPLDALYLDGAPLFLKMPVFYTLDASERTAPSHVSTSWVGLLISDETADPQRAVFSVARLFPNSRALDIKQFDVEKLTETAPPDFVVISGHGSVVYGGLDYIHVSDQEKFLPATMVQLRPKLVYFDSCNLANSVQFHHALRDSGTTYMIAPMLSNEAGNSSTKTIELVFENIAQGEDPVAALFTTRRALWSIYSKGDLRVRLMRAFPFRIYVLR
jgi:hypothetical protein